MKVFVKELRSAGMATLIVAISCGTMRGDQPRNAESMTPAEPAAVERLPAIRPIITPAIAPQLTKPPQLLPTPPGKVGEQRAVQPAVHSRPLDATAADHPTGIKDRPAAKTRTAGERIPAVLPQRLPAPVQPQTEPQPKQGAGTLPKPVMTATQAAATAGSVQPAAYHVEAGIGKCRECGKSRRDCRCADQLGVGEFDKEIQQRVKPANHYRPHSAEVVAEPTVAAYVPWWQPKMSFPQREGSRPLPLTLDDVILQALEHSHFIRAQSNVPLMSEQGIMEAAAEFDVHAFTQSRFSRLSEPVGNTLVTGPGRSRFRDRNFTHNAGIRKKTYTGASVELAQRYGYQRNNSDFLIPNPQSTTQLALRFSQPLLRGSGKFYNNSLVVLAELDRNIAWDQFTTELQDHLLEVAGAYWELYLQRAVLVQRERHYERAQEILAELDTRGDIDAAQSQIVRARAAVASRRSDLARAYAATRNAQVRLRALVNSPELSDEAVELVPGEQPNPAFVDVALQDAIVTAMENRPEIDEAIQQLRSARLQVSITQNELLPILDVVTETYVAGLGAGSSIGNAWVDQFQVGEPSYTVGLEMEVPLHNRAARARHKRKKLQLKWIVSRYKDTLENLVAEVEIVVRDVRTAYVEMSGKYHALQATKAELDYLTDRWRLLPGDDRSASFLLEDILDIQDRLVGHEFEYARAQVAYTQSLVELKRATGTLLQAEDVSLSRGCECGIPQMYLSKPAQLDTQPAGWRGTEPVVIEMDDGPASREEPMPVVIEELPAQTRPAPGVRLQLEPLEIPQSD